MAVDNGAIVRPGAGRSAAKRDFKPTILASRKQQYVVEFNEMTLVDQKSFDTRNLPDDQANFEKKVRITLIVLTADQKESSGHGARIWLYATPKVTPPGDNRKASTLYLLACDFLNESNPLSAEQRADAINQLNKLEETKAQFYVLAKGSENKNILDSVVGPVEAKDKLPKWEAPKQPLDPRTADDDPLIRCSVTGEQIHGFAVTNRETNQEEWWSATTWEKKQIEFLGDKAIYVFPDQPGKKYAPPFGRQYYRLAKEQKLATQ